MVFYATFKNISVILWQSVLLVEETGVLGEITDLTQVTDKLYHIMLYRVHLVMSGFEATTVVMRMLVSASHVFLSGDKNLKMTI